MFSFNGSFTDRLQEKNRAPYKLFSPAWVLAPPRALKEVAETWGQAGEQGSVLFLCYCLSHDQRWLLAAATDARGELLDTAAINIHVPHRYGGGGALVKLTVDSGEIGVKCPML